MIIPLNQIDKIVDNARLMLSKYPVDHDVQHAERVHYIAQKIASSYSIDKSFIRILSFLHDLDDWKVLSTHHSVELLKYNGVKDSLINKIINEIDLISYKGAGVESIPHTLEGKIVQDADRIDALGAIGVSRAFMYAGRKNKPIRRSGEVPIFHTTFDDYQASASSSLTHYYEKLQYLFERLNTPEAIKIAKPRHIFLTSFYEELMHELSDYT
jgi:uncharacterized protein